MFRKNALRQAWQIPKRTGTFRPRTVFTRYASRGKPVEYELDLISMKKRKVEPIPSQDRVHNPPHQLLAIENLPRISIELQLNYEKVRRKVVELERTENPAFEEYFLFTVKYEQELNAFLTFLKESYDKKISQFSQLSSLELLNSLYVFKSYYTSKHLQSSTLDAMFSELEEVLATDPRFPSLLTNNLLPLTGTDVVDLYASGIDNFKNELIHLRKDIDFSGLRSLGDLLQTIGAFLDRFDEFSRQEHAAQSDLTVMLSLVFEINRYKTLKQILAKNSALPIETLEVVLSNNTIGTAVKSEMAVDVAVKKITSQVDSAYEQVGVKFNNFGEFIGSAAKKLIDLLNSTSSLSDAAETVLKTYTGLFASGWIEGHLLFYTDPKSYYDHEIRFVTLDLYKHKDELSRFTNGNDPLELAYSQNVRDMIAKVDPVTVDVGLSPPHFTQEPLLQPQEIAKYRELLAPYVLLLHLFQIYNNDYFRLENVIDSFDKFAGSNRYDAIRDVLHEVDTKHFGSFQHLLDMLFQKYNIRWMHPVEEYAQKEKFNVNLRDHLITRGIMSRRQWDFFMNFKVTHYRQIPDELNLHVFEPQILAVRSSLGKLFSESSPLEILNTFAGFDGAIYRKAQNRVRLLFDENGGHTAILDTLLHNQSVFSKLEQKLKKKEKEPEYKQIPEDLRLHSFEQQLLVVKKLLGKSYGQSTREEIFAALDEHILRVEKSAIFKKLENRLKLLFDMNGGNTAILDTLLHSQSVFSSFEEKKKKKETESRLPAQSLETLELDKFEPQLIELKRILNKPFAQTTFAELMAVLDKHIDENENVAIYNKLKNRLKLLDSDNENMAILDTVLHSQAVFATFEKKKNSQAKEAKVYKQIPDSFRLEEYAPELTRLRSELQKTFKEVSSQDVLKAVSKKINEEEGATWAKLHRNLLYLFIHNGADTGCLDAVLNSNKIFLKFEKEITSKAKIPPVFVHNSELLNHYGDIVRSVTSGLSVWNEQTFAEQLKAEREKLTPLQYDFLARGFVLDQLESFNSQIEDYARFFPEMLYHQDEGGILTPAVVEKLYLAYIELSEYENIREKSLSYLESAAILCKVATDSLHGLTANNVLSLLEHNEEENDSEENMSPLRAAAMSLEYAITTNSNPSDMFDQASKACQEAIDGIHAAENAVHKALLRSHWSKLAIENADIAKISKQLEVVLSASETLAKALAHARSSATTDSLEKSASHVEWAHDLTAQAQSLVKTENDEWGLECAGIASVAASEAFDYAEKLSREASAKLALAVEKSRDAETIADACLARARRAEESIHNKKQPEFAQDKQLSKARIAVPVSTIEPSTFDMREFTEVNDYDESLKQGVRQYYGSSDEDAEIKDALSIALNGNKQDTSEPTSKTKRNTSHHVRPELSSSADNNIDTESIESFLQDAKKKSELQRESLSRQADAYAWSKSRAKELGPLFQNNMEYMLLTLEGQKLRLDISVHQTATTEDITDLLKTLPRKEQARFSKTYNRLRKKGWKLAGLKMDKDQKFVILSRVHGGSFSIKLLAAFKLALATTGVILVGLIGVGYILEDAEPNEKWTDDSEEVVTETPAAPQERSLWKRLFWK